MIRIVSLILVIMAIVFNMVAQDSNDNTSTIPIVLESHPIDNSAESNRHRTSIRINIEAYYNPESHAITVSSNGKTDGTVSLYLNGTIIDYRPEINASFLVITSGLYTIEIIGETWIAIGYIQL